MLSKFKECLEEHIDMINEKSGPYWVFLAGILITIILLFLYQYHFTKISETVGKIIPEITDYGFLSAFLSGVVISLCIAIYINSKNIHKKHN